MLKNSVSRLWVCFGFLLFACQPTVPIPTTPPPPSTATSTPPATVQMTSCADLDRTWAQGDWRAALDVLGELEKDRVQCGIESLASKRYAVLINLATQLESESKIDQAVPYYREALALDGQRQEALRGLVRLNGLPEPTPAPCDPEPLEPYAVAKNHEAFATVVGLKIVVGGKPFPVRGVNYYPRNAPWQGFLAQGDLKEIEREFDLIATRGFNTLRIFLWYDALFQCEPERAVPNVETFRKLDRVIQLADERNLHLIVTLNDLPDFYFRPIYTDWARYDAQTEFIVKRYRQEPRILVWDVRNEGDIDYGVSGAGMPGTTRDPVMAWLEHITGLVRASDPHHLVMAGWLENGLETAPYTDVLSIHHWSNENGLATKISQSRSSSSKPTLVEEMGAAGMGSDGEADQAEWLARMVATVDESSSAGWLVWTAFDFFALPDSLAGPEFRFGLWRNDLSPKPALDRLPIPTSSP